MFRAATARRPSPSRAEDRTCPIARRTVASEPLEAGGGQMKEARFESDPTKDRPASVLWKPPGATRFCSRQTWGRQVAYQTQFNDWTKRAHDVTAPSSSAAILGSSILLRRLQFLLY